MRKQITVFNPRAGTHGVRTIRTQQLAESLEWNSPIQQSPVMGCNIRSKRGQGTKADDGKWKVDGHGVSIREARAMQKCRHAKSRSDYKVICAPSSTTRPGGSWKYAVAGEALRAMIAKRESRRWSINVAFLPTP